MAIDEGKIVNEMDSFFNSAMKARRPSERRWLINMAFFIGQQWLSWSWARWQLYRPPAPTWRVHLVINKIFPNVLDIVSKLASKLAEQHVIPSKTEGSALDRAKGCEKVLKHIDRENDTVISNQKLMLWRTVYGLAYKDIGWDADKGRNLQYSVEENGAIREGEINLGEVDVNVRSPFELLWQPGVKSFRDSKRIMILNRETLEDVKERYPKKADEIKTDSFAGLTPMEMQLARLMGEQPSYLGANTGDMKTEGYCLVKEMRELPSKKYKRGRLIRTCGHTLLKYEESLPFEYMVKNKCLGIMEYPYIDTGERVNGETPVTQAIPMQMELNKTASQLVEIRNLMAKPKWFAFKELHLDESAMTSEPGEVIEGNYAGGIPAPTQLSPKPMPAYVENIQDRMTTQIQDEMSIHEVTKGQAPPGVKSGVAIRLLQEQDERSFGPVSVSFEKREEVVGKWKLELVKEMYKEPRLIKVLGENNRLEVEEFLATEDMPTEVYVVAGSSFTESKVGRQELIFSMFERGFFGDPQDESVRQRILKLAEVGGLEMVYQEAMMDENETERENRLFERGIPSPVNDFDNHEVHFVGHNMFRKTDKYRNLHPQIQQAIAEHVGAHQQNLVETQMQQQEQAERQRQEVMEAEAVRSAREKAADDRAKLSLDMVAEAEQIERDAEEVEAGIQPKTKAKAKAKKK